MGWFPWRRKEAPPSPTPSSPHVLPAEPHAETVQSVVLDPGISVPGSDSASGPARSASLSSPTRGRSPFGRSPAPSRASNSPEFARAPRRRWAQYEPGSPLESIAPEPDSPTLPRAPTFMGILRVQRDAQAGAERAQKEAAQANVVGDHIIQELNKQRETELFIDERLDELELQIMRAKKDLAAYTRTKMRDKCCVGLTIVCSVLFLLMIILRSANPMDVSTPAQTDVNSTAS
eukprot:TRINITY_DN13301_c0_g1_i1.p1 TRINITY_DN13301_c0_g1~~TRINITY_DN13301_c0_g1_i1.p1  ORF type:complete len:233 (+),score=55.22 TRINITY_DN13301_c0_g1_i1:78-776(+)